MKYADSLEVSILNSLHQYCEKSHMYEICLVIYIPKFIFNRLENLRYMDSKKRDSETSFNAVLEGKPFRGGVVPAYEE